MIIIVNGFGYEVYVDKKFTPSYNRSIKYQEMLNGSTFTRDRGVDSDIYQTEVSVIGDTEDILNIVDSLVQETNQITVQCYNEYIFGPALDYSESFTCNVIGNPISFPLRDVLTSTLTLSLQIVSQVEYDSTVSTDLPEIYYNYPVNRVTTVNKHNFRSLSQGDYGTTVLVGADNKPIRRKETSFSALHTQQEMAELQRFVSLQRDQIFTWTTSNVLTLFDSPTISDDDYTYQVKIMDFSFRPNGQLFWDSVITLIQD